MRKLLFAHDDRVLIQADGRPVSFNYSRNLVDRYRYLADHVTFAIRGAEAGAVRWFEDADIVSIPEMKHGRELLRYRLAKKKVEKLVHDHDIVVARLPSLIGSWALREAWRCHKPVMIECVGCPWDALWNHSLKGKLVAPFFWAKNRWLMSRAGDVIYVTRSFLQRRYPCSGRTLACSNVEVQRASKEAMERRLARVAEIRRGAPIVLGTTANLDVRYKGHDLVIRALAALGDKADRFTYRLIGPGDPGRLRALAERLGVIGRLEFLGGVDRAKIPDALDAVDVYIHPSRQEGLPRAMIEAMARGCIVVGARTGGIPELLEDEWVVPRGDWRAIVDLLQDLTARQLEAACRRNHAEAGRYEFAMLTAARERFYDHFLAEYNLSSNAIVAAQFNAG